MPEGAVYVGRPARWGNPFVVETWVPEGDPIELQHRATRCDVVDMFADAMAGLRTDVRPFSEHELADLRGKDLVCWCPLDEPCHADVLLELANREPA